MTGLSERRQVTVWLTEAIAAGARQDRACAGRGLSTAHGYNAGRRMTLYAAIGWLARGGLRP